MKKLLIYVEPHPMRNTFTEMKNVGWMITKSFMDFCPRDYDFKVFSNNEVIDEFIKKTGTHAHTFIRPTSGETGILQSLMSQWNQGAINLRSQLVLGNEAICKFYYHILKRIYTEIYKFDGIALWSDNGAARKFAADHGIPVCHMELGPTRSPFQPTIYFDPLGTNGFASVLKAPLDKLEPAIIVPRDAWIARKASFDDSTDTPGIIDGSMTFNAEYEYHLDEDYICLGLQLADDLNALLFSPFPDPASFVKKICEDFRDTGLKVLVKGHPGAPVRPYNIIKQEEAFAVARSYPHAQIARDKMYPNESLATLLFSRAVVTVNSSLSFEASLMRKSAYVAGGASYNLQGLYNYNRDAILANSARSDDRLDKLTSFLLCHYFHPDEPEYLCSRICDYFDFMFENGTLDIAAETYWKKWIERFDYGYRYLAGRPQQQRWQKEPLSLNKALSGQTVLADFYVDGNSIAFDYTCKVSGRAGGVGLARGHFYLCVDNADIKNNTIYLNGWCLSKAQKLPPAFLCIACDGKIISRHRLAMERNDVLESMGMDYPVLLGFQFEFPNPDKREAKDFQILAFSEDNLCEIFPLRLGMQGI